MRSVKVPPVSVARRNSGIISFPPDERRAKAREKSVGRHRERNDDEGGHSQKIELVELLSHQRDAPDPELHSKKLSRNHRAPGETMGEQNADEDARKSGRQNDRPVGPER